MSTLNNLQYEIKYKNVKNINMRIKKDGVLSVSAPHGVSSEEIEKVISKYYNKFYKAQQETINKNNILNTTPQEKTYVYLCGKKYVLESVKDTKYSYSVGENKVTLYYKNIEKDYERMLRDLAQNFFNKLSKEISVEMDLEYIDIEPKKFSRCFGKNYNKKNIALNYLLIHMDVIYIKHVLYHEYAHCIVFDHSKKFYDLLSLYDINHRKNKKYIAENLHKYC